MVPMQQEIFGHENDRACTKREPCWRMETRGWSSCLPATQQQEVNISNLIKDTVTCNKRIMKPCEEGDDTWVKDRGTNKT